MTTVLRGRRILCTRPAGADAELVALLRAAGALADALPVLATSPIDGGVHALDRALEERPDWAVAFTSATAVAVAEPLLHRLIGRVVAAVGPASARALASHGVTATVVPTLSTARALGAALAAAGVTGVIGAVALEPLPDLADTLLAAQIDYASVALYSTERLHLDPATRDAFADADLICVASPSAVRSLRENAITANLVAIGPTTARAALDEGFSVAAVAESPSPAGMVAACQWACSGGGPVSDRA